MLIGNGFESSLQEKTDKRNYFVFVGRIDKIKNLEGIILLFSKLVTTSKYFTDWELKIIGNIEYNKEYVLSLKNYAHGLGIQHQVNFLGEKTGEVKMHNIAAAQALICLSHFETDPIAIKEALSVGTKVIITPRYGLADYDCKENVFSVSNGLEFDIDEFEKFVKNQFITGSHFFGWDEVARKYEFEII